MDVTELTVGTVVSIISALLAAKELAGKPVLHVAPLIAPLFPLEV